MIRKIILFVTNALACRCKINKNISVDVVKAHVLLVLDLNELGGSGVRDFGLAKLPYSRVLERFLTPASMKMASLTLVGTERIFCLLTDRMALCPGCRCGPKDTQFNQ